MIDKLEKLKAERVQLLNIQNDVQATLRKDKNVQATADDDHIRENARRNVGRSIHTLGRIGARLTELREEIRTENLRIEDERTKKRSA